MTVLIISSKIDPASINIKKSLLEQSTWEEIDLFCNNPVYKNKKNNLTLITINDRKITHNNIDKEFYKQVKIKPKHAIFISRHTSKTEKPTLTVHPIGNYNDALFGGKEKELVKSSPKIMTGLLRKLKKYHDKKKLYHDVCFEVTHHGPVISIPSLFIEIGSTKLEWTKLETGDVIAKSILELFEEKNTLSKLNEYPVLIGLGGGHYAPRFTDVALERKVTFGHMIPSYHINAGNIDEKIIDKSIENTPELYGLYIHRKALKKSQVNYFKQIFEDKGIKTYSSKDFEKIKSNVISC